MTSPQAKSKSVFRHKFYDPRRRWPFRTLTFTFASMAHMSDDDDARLVECINRHYRLPPPPELPVSLTLKYGIRRTAMLDRHGIQLRIRGTVHQFTWHDVAKIVITRPDPLRRDFCELWLELPDHQLEFKIHSSQYGDNPTWSGATAEQLNEFLFRYGPAAKIDVQITGRTPTNRGQIERDLNQAKDGRRALVYIAVFTGLSFGPILIWMAIDAGLLKALVVGVFFLMPVVPVLVYGYLRQSRRATKLQRQLQAAGGNPTAPQSATRSTP